MFSFLKTTVSRFYTFVTASYKFDERVQFTGFYAGHTGDVRMRGWFGLRYTVKLNAFKDMVTVSKWQIKPAYAEAKGYVDVDMSSPEVAEGGVSAGRILSLTEAVERHNERRVQVRPLP